MLILSIYIQGSKLVDHGSVYGSFAGGMRAPEGETFRTIHDGGANIALEAVFTVAVATRGSARRSMRVRFKACSADYLLGEQLT